MLFRLGYKVSSFANGAEEDEMWLDLRDGRAFFGAEAIVFLSFAIWWARPLGLISKIPGMRFLLQTGYRHLADNHHCKGRLCSRENK